MAIEIRDVVPSQFVGSPVLTNGNTDFWGPPDFRARFWLENRSEIVYLHFRLSWEETKPDFTRFGLNSTMALFDIRSQLGPDWYFVQFSETYDLDIGAVQIPGINQGLQEVYNSNAGMVASIRAEGDSWGGIFGGPDNPNVEIDFNRIYFKVSNDHS